MKKGCEKRRSKRREEVANFKKRGAFRLFIVIGGV